jgi:peptide/nickel transport system ATP-binding protein
MNESENTPVLDIKQLTVAYQHGDAWLEAVREVSMRINAGEIYGLVGESGSGKTTLIMAVMRYLGETGGICRGEILLQDTNLLALNDSEIRKVWGKAITLVPQNPLSSLNPSMRIGEQLAEILHHQLDLDLGVARQRSIEWLEKVRLPDPERTATQYPHQVSGGMQQRVLIAMALSTEPQLLVLDEPTSNLDVTTQAVILDLINDLMHGRDTAVLYVTHNLGVVAQVCDRVAVMYASELVEDAPTQDLFRKPLHPYTQGLMDSLPQLGDTKDNIQLRAITGQIPTIGKGPSGCIFRTRCPIAIEKCETRPPLIQIGEARFSRCHRWDEIEAETISARQISQEEEAHRLPSEGGESTLLQIDDLKVHFSLRRSVGEWLKRDPIKKVRAVDGVDLEITPNTTLGLVGESGSGKTTIARAVMGLEERTDGSIDLLSIPLPEKLSKRELETLRLLQMVFQNPEGALNPYLTVGESLSRPLRRLLNIPANEADVQVQELLQAVQLPPEYASRLPGQLSGGELQRVAIARAFASNPELLVLDEPVSSLDVSVQAAILNLIGELQADHQTSLLFISHDLAVVGYVADLIAVIYLGTLMEISKPEELFTPPHHPYTEALLAAIPVADPEQKCTPVYLPGDIPDPVDRPGGCPFHTRCPRYLGEICATQSPPWQIDKETGKRVYCHISLEKLKSFKSEMNSPGAVIKD